MSLKLENIKNIVFDLGGVLVDWNPRYLYSKVFQDSAEMEYFLNHVCNQAWNEKQDAGRLFAEAIKIKIEEHPKYANEIEIYFSRWAEMLNGSIDQTVQILSQLSATKKYRMLALTNWSQETFGIARERFDFLNTFEGIVVSGEVKMIKPDPQIFKHLCDQFEIHPEESLFIDDSMANIESAAGLHFITHHFLDPESLSRALQCLLPGRN